MIEYVITDNKKGKLVVVWGKDKWLDCDWKQHKDGGHDTFYFTHDEAKKLAAFIMAQVEEK